MRYVCTLCFDAPSSEVTLKLTSTFLRPPRMVCPLQQDPSPPTRKLTARLSRFDSNKLLLTDEEDEEEGQEEIDLNNVIGSRTRGKVIDFAKAAEENPAEDDEDEDDDDDFEGDEMDED